MKKFMVIISMMCLFSAGVSAEDAVQDTANLKKQPQMMYVQTAQKGSFDGKVVRLDNCSATTLYFSDRPYRLTGHIATKDFFKLWYKGKDSFKRIAPNAVLSILEEGNMAEAVVSLYSPVYEDGTLTYSVKILEGFLPERFAMVSLFIDAYPTAVNSQITDSVTQANTKILGDSPMVAMGNLYQATAQALSNAAHNATTAQQQTNVTAQAATTQGVSELYSLDTASTGISTRKIFR